MSKILSVEQERETINWYSKQPPPWSGIILALFFSITLSLFFFSSYFFHQSDIRVPWQQNWALDWGLVVFHTHNDTSFTRALPMISVRWLAMPSLPRRSHTHTHTHTLSLRQPSCWPWAESGVSCPPNCIPTPLHSTQKDHTMQIQLVRERKWLAAAPSLQAGLLRWHLISAA